MEQLAVFAALESTAAPVEKPQAPKIDPVLLHLGPLSIRWRYLPRLWPWLTRFIRAGATPERVGAVAAPPNFKAELLAYALLLDGHYADVLEQALYNGVLPGISLDGKNYFYVNALKKLKDFDWPMRWSSESPSRASRRTSSRSSRRPDGKARH